MTLEELSKIDFKIWTGDGYKSLSNEELNEKIQLKLFEHEAFSWSGGDRIAKHPNANSLFVYKGLILHGGYVDFFDEHDNIKISIEDILDHDDGGL